MTSSCTTALRRLKSFLSPPLSLALNFLTPIPSTATPSHKTLKTLTKRTAPQSPKSNTTTKSPTPSSNCKVLVTSPSLKHDVSTHPDAEPILSLLSESSNQSSNVDDLLREFKNKLTSDLVLEILKNYRRLGRPRTLEFFSWAGFQLGFRFDDPVVEYMADFLGRRKLFDDLKCLLKTVSSSKGRVSTRVVSICIRFLGRQGRVVEALALFETMELELNCVPDNLVFNNVLYVLCKKDTSSKSIDIALTIFHRIGQPDVYSYSNIIAGLCRFGRVEGALEIFREMGRANLVPTRSAANVLIGKLCEMACKSGLVEKVRVTNVRRPFDILVPMMRAKSGIEPAVEVFWVVLESGLLPSKHVVIALISELCRLGKLEEAIAIVKLVESRKLRYIDESYNIVITTLSEVHKVNEACDLLEKMIIEGLKPKLMVYNSIIRALCKLGNVEEAQKYFENMNSRRCKPDRATYAMLIKACSAVQNWQAAYSLLIEMIELGWHPHINTYNLVNDLLDKNGRPDLSLKLGRKMEIQNLIAQCKAGKLEAACDRLNSMLAKCFQLPIYARDAFERAFKRSGKWKTAQDLLEKMDQMPIQNKVQA